MKKDSKARIVTVAVVLTLLAALAARKMGWRLPEAKASQDPQDTIYAMIDAARTGNVKAYLAEFTGQMEASLRQSLAETTESSFAKYLIDSNSAIQGVAVSDPQKITDQEAKVRVEYVFQDRNEAQTMYLEKSANGWKIARADSDERVKTLIPYGTPVK